MLIEDQNVENKSVEERTYGTSKNLYHEESIELGPSTETKVPKS